MKATSLLSGDQSGFHTEDFKFSPDGAYVAALRSNHDTNSHEIVVHDLIGDETHTIDDGVQPYVRWSPDGRFLAYLSNGAQNANLSVWDTRTDDFANVASFSPGRVCYGIQWSTLGTRIIYWTNEHDLDVKEIYSVLPMGGDTINLSGESVAGGDVRFDRDD